MPDTKRATLPKKIWAYAYEILPPQPAARLHAIKSLLDHAHTDAQRDARTWTGRVVVAEQITHILIVSDSPEQNHEGNRKLEAELQQLDAGFSLTVPIAVADDAAESNVPHPS